MSVILHQEKILNSNGTTGFATQIIANCEEDKLVVFCCDTGDAVTRSYKDSGVEYWMTVDKANLYKLSLVLHVYNKDWQTGILQAIQAKFKGVNCYFELRDFFEQYGIEYKNEIWI